MSDTLASLVVKLVGDTAGFTQSIGDAEKDAKGFTQRMSELGPKVAAAGAGLTLGVTAPIVGLFSNAVDGASDLSETVSKAGVVFGKQGDAVIAWSEQSAQAFGMSQNAALGAAATYGNLLVSMGLTEDKSAGMSKSLVALAGDLASFNNISTDEALEKLRAGLTGESEPLKSLGININETILKNEALRLGLISTTKEALDPAAKAQAAYSLMLAQTGTAQGDFARTSDGLANSQRIASAEFTNATAALGTSLLPIVTQATQFVTTLMTAFNTLSPAMQQNVTIALAIAAALGPVLTIVGGLMTVLPAIGGAFAAVAGVIGGPVVAVIAIVVAAVAALAYAWQNNLGGIQETVQSIGAVITEIFGKIGAFIEAHRTEIEAALRIAWNTIKFVITVAVTLIGGIIKAFMQALNGDWSGAWQTIQTTVETVLKAAKDYIDTTLAEVGRIIAAAWTDLTGKAEIAWNSLKDSITGAIQGAIDWIGEQGTTLIDIGKNIIQGIIDGITQAPQTILSTLSGIVNGAIDAIKKSLGMASPSKVFANIGSNMMAGMAIGIERAGELPAVQLQGVVSDLAAVQVPSVSGGALAGQNTVSIEMHFHGNADAAAVEDGTVRALRRAGLMVMPA
jgi:hypothetical protein